MSKVFSSKVFVAAFLGLLVAALALFVLRGETEREVVSDVTHVRSSDVSGAPRNSGGTSEGADTRGMVASYYASSLEGSPTASGESYEPERYTAAHKSLPIGTELRVAYGGESVKVVVNDRGPFVGGRDIDLSLVAAEEIGLTATGTAPVRVTVL